MSMKNFLIILLGFYFSSRAQISITTNFPEKIALNFDFDLEIKIFKGPVKNYSKYEIQVPQGIDIKEGDSKSGTFSFEQNKAKLIWAITPVEDEFKITLKFSSGNIPGTKTINQKYYYLEKGERRETEMAPITLIVGEGSEITKETKPDTTKSATLSADPEQLKTEVTQLKKGEPITATSMDEFNKKALDKSKQDAIAKGASDAKNLYKPYNAGGGFSPLEIRMQVAQIRRDAREAREVGENEKKRAEIKLSESGELFKKADAISDELERNKALEIAHSTKKRAEKDIEVASKILTLAKSLDDNATELERVNLLNKPETSSVVSTSSATAESQKMLAKEEKKTETLTEKSNEKKNIKTESDKNSVSHEDVNKLNKIFGEEKKSAPEPALAKGTVYRIQIGSFNSTPHKSQFSGLTKVDIVKEGGKYKALYGNFATKDEALNKLIEVRTKHEDGFLVLYKDGVRVK